jgi:hypothetical protein
MHQISRAASEEHDGVRKLGGYARGGADTHEYRAHPAAVPNDARFAPRRTRTFRARRICFTSCQTARASAHRAVHLDRPDTQARACSWRHANAQASGDGTERVYTFGRRSFSPSICSPEVRASLVLVCLRFLLPKQRELTKLFSLFDANLKHTVSLRRPSMPNDGLKRCALRIDERCP